MNPRANRNRGSYITGTHPERGTLWAAIDPAAHHLTGRVEDIRFAAYLAPYPSKEEAEAALLASGATLKVAHG